MFHVKHMGVLQSASKLAFLGLMLTACVGFLIGKLEAKDFMVLAIAASAFYFSSKGDLSQPFAGK